MKIIARIFFCIIVFISIQDTFAQANRDSAYYNYQYYLCKIWGFAKYFHSEIAKGEINWDNELLLAMSNIKKTSSAEEFNSSILNMLNSAGEPVQSSRVLPDIKDELKYNLNLLWMNDSILSDSVKKTLNLIKERFRPQKNYYVDKSISPAFETDNQFYDSENTNHPSEEFRLLALFRYWNIINYFFPYKNIMDQNWDITLSEFIPKFVNSTDVLTYNLIFLQLSTRINDSHAFIHSNIIGEEIFGNYFFPLELKYIENETVVTNVLSSDLDIAIGDIIQSIDNQNIYDLRDSLKKYTPGSNITTINRNINNLLLRNTQMRDEVSLSIISNEGLKNITIPQNIHIWSYYKLLDQNTIAWKIIKTDSKIFGYVNMGVLEIEDVPKMFNGLWETDAIVFDIRNYPKGTMWHMINYLFDSPIHISNYTLPNIEYPGTLFWNSDTIGSGDFSKTYDKEIFLLFDETTQSQAEYTVMGLEQHPKAIKVGSQTAGADGNVSKIFLPGGISTYMTGVGIFYPDYTATQRIGIVPDIEVLPTIKGIREGKDEVLEAALNSSAKKYQFLSKPILFQNYPNPFNNSTTIEISLFNNGEIKLRVYDTLGKLVKTIYEGNKAVGFYRFIWNGKNNNGSSVSSGIYFLNYEYGGKTISKKLVLLK